MVNKMNHLKNNTNMEIKKIHATVNDNEMKVTQLKLQSVNERIKKLETVKTYPQL